MAARRQKKLICGTKGEIVVAHGRQPSPARWAACFIRFCFVVAQKKIAADQLIYRALIYPANYQSSELIDLASYLIDVSSELIDLVSYLIDI